MSVTKRFAVIASAIIVGLTGIPLPAEAQLLEEVVVTAQRREQNVLDVPISIDLLTEAEVADLNDVRDLYMVSPSVTFVSGVASSTQAINIRGVGGGAHVSAFEPSVAIVVDQVSAGPGGAALTEFWDVERIEVLNGPQGTLFGKNVSAGLVSIVTKDPTDEFGGKFGLRWENEYEEYRIEGMVNGPLSDNMNGRVSFYGLEQKKGLVENIVRGTEDNNKGRWGVRGKLAYDNEENFTFDASLSFERQDNECCSRAITALDPEILASPTGLFAALFLVPAVDATGLVVGDDNLQTINDSYAYEDTETVHGVFEAALELNNGHTLKSITGYRTWDQAEWNDVDSYPDDFIRGGLTHDMTLFTQEFQYVSPTGGDLEYLLGFYYYNMDLDEQTILEGCSTVCTVLFGSPTPLFFRTTWTSNVQTENIAAFGHATYKFNDKWQGFAGARILREDLDVTGHSCSGPSVISRRRLPATPIRTGWARSACSTTRPTTPCSTGRTHVVTRDRVSTTRLTAQSGLATRRSLC
jgi:iron complex outermembrane receptor protein